MHAIVVGAGGIARELLRRLGERWEVTVVDTSVERLEQARGLRPSRGIEGDGSSRVVLTRAGLDGADALVAATNDDAVNLEACRLAHEAEISRLVAVAADPERLDDYRRLGVTAISPDGLAARRIELSLETRRISSTAFADGRAEVIEFRIAPDSTVRGKALRDLHAYSWIVGVILRGNDLIIPHGDTVLEADDLVTVVGAGADFADIVRTFTSSEGRFPLNYGKRIAVALESERDVEDALAEAVRLARNSKASGMTLVHVDPDAVTDPQRADRIRRFVERASVLAEGVATRSRPVKGRPSRALASLPAVESVGAIVIGLTGRGRIATWWRTVRAASLVRRTARPVLLSRGSHPYRRVLVPARRTRSGRAAARAAIDLAHFSAGTLLGAAIEDPLFLSGPGPPTEARRAIAWLEEEAAVRGIGVEGTIRRGNPVRELLALGEEADLIVLGVPPRRAGVISGFGLAGLVAQRAPRSVLLVPAGERG